MIYLVIARTRTDGFPIRAFETATEAEVFAESVDLQTINRHAAELYPGMYEGKSDTAIEWATISVVKIDNGYPSLAVRIREVGV